MPGQTVLTHHNQETFVRKPAGPEPVMVGWQGWTAKDQTQKMTHVLAVVSIYRPRPGNIGLHFVILVKTGTILTSTTWNTNMQEYKVGTILDNKEAEKCCHKCGMDVWPASLTHVLHNANVKKCFCLGIRKLLIRSSQMVYTIPYYPASSVPDSDMTAPGAAGVSFITCDPWPSGLARRKRSLGEGETFVKVLTAYYQNMNISKEMIQWLITATQEREMKQQQRMTILLLTTTQV